MNREDFFSRESVRDLYTKQYKVISFIRDIDFSTAELIQLAILHKDQPYTTDMYEVLASHPNANDAVHRKLIELSVDWHSLVNAIATSGLASTAILNDFLKWGVDRFEELHIRLALFAYQLNRVTISDYGQLMKSVEGEDDFSIAARDQIAHHPATPDYILRILAGDDYDHVAKSATSALQVRKQK